MTKKIVRPILPTAPAEYDQNYVNQLARVLESLIDEVKATSINIQGVKGNGSANVLESGDIYIGDGGFLRIVRNEDIFSGTHVATGAVGTVTIVIS